MQISYNWLKSYLPDLNLSPEGLAALLNERSFETEVIGQIKLDPHIKVVKITALNPHPNADRLRLATITDGSEELTVVCGAPNIKVGDIVPYAPPGSLVQDENGEPFQLRVAKIRGVESPGMLNSPRELGLGPSHAGILILPAGTPLGSRLKDHLPDDSILQADITPNRASDSMGHLGIAREISALLNLNISEDTPAPFPDQSLADWKISVENPAHCSRYWGALMENITITDSPLWIQARLLSAGVRPINNVVDCSNYVMLETGQPTHAFDADTLPRQQIGVRLARAGESLVTLDNITRSLSPDNLVITDADQPVALAGVMGGSVTQVTPETKRVFLEVANFSGYIIQKSSATLNLITDSSQRFRRGLPPALIPSAAARFVELLSQTAGGKFVGAVEHRAAVLPAPVITFRPRRVNAIAGIEYAPLEISQTLKRLRCEVKENTPDSWLVTPPADRLDLAIENDLAEEVIRLHGFDNIPARIPETKNPALLPSSVLWEETTRDLAAAFGGTETYNYSFSNENFCALLNPDVNAMHPEPRLRLSNPPTPTQTFLRDSLLPKLLEDLKSNKAALRRKTTSPERSLFEIGSVFIAKDSGRVPGVTESKHFGFVSAGADADTLRQLLDQILQSIGITGVSFEAPQNRQLFLLHTDMRALIFSNQSVGLIGSLQPQHWLVRKLQQPVACLELNLSALIPHAVNEPAFTPVLEHNAVQYHAPGKYPAVFRDISLKTDNPLSADTIQAALERLGGEHLKDTELFDTYENSFSFHLTLQASDHTLTDTEADQIIRVITRGLKDELNLDIRE